MADDSQSCFGGNYCALPPGYTQQEVISAVKKLNGMTAKEVAAHWNYAGKNMNNLIYQLKNLIFSSNAEENNFINQFNPF